MTSPINADTKLDARGLYCPEPVMMLHNKIADMNSGEIVQIIATDPSTQRDIPKFCGFLGHELIDQATEQDEFLYWVRKGS